MLLASFAGGATVALLVVINAVWDGYNFGLLKTILEFMFINGIVSVVIVRCWLL